LVYKTEKHEVIRTGEIASWTFIDIARKKLPVCRQVDLTNAQLSRRLDEVFMPLMHQAQRFAGFVWQA
jgi:hypothetical protein